MTQVQQAARVARPAKKTAAEVEAMLRDIATVLRLTAKVKEQMVSERAAADHQALLAAREARVAQLDAVLV